MPIVFYPVRIIEEKLNQTFGKMEEIKVDSKILCKSNC